MTEGWSHPGWPEAREDRRAHLLDMHALGLPPACTNNVLPEPAHTCSWGCLGVSCAPQSLKHLLSSSLETRSVHLCVSP